MTGRLAAVGALACALVFMVGSAGAAPSASLVISQIYGGGGNTGAPFTNDYIEVFNRGTTTVNLSGYSVQYASATGLGNFGSNPVTPLSGSLAPGQYYLVQQSGGANGVPLPTADATGTVNMSASAGKVIVANTTTGLACNGGSTPCSAAQLAQIVDLIGYGSTNFFEGAPAPTLSNTTAALRAFGGCKDTDDNSTDFSASGPSPRNTASPANVCDAPTGAGSANPSPVQAGEDTLLTVTVTPASTPPSTGLAVTGDLTAIGGSASQSFSDQGGNVFTHQATVPAGTAPGTKTLPVSITDAEGRTGSSSIALIVSEPCGAPTTPIYQIQGSGSSTPIPGNVATEGVVVGDFEGSAAASGFYLQDATGDGNAATSDGIFVFTGSTNLVSPGQHVRVTGFARERFNQTTINGTNSNTSPVTNVVVCGTGSVAATDVTMPFAALDAPERYEGMLVRFPQPLTIAEYFNYDRFGEIVLGLPLAGEPRLFTPTAIEEPGAPAQARLLANQLRRITLDDAQSAQNPPVLRHPNGGTFSLANLFRGGDTVQNAVGVLGFDFSLYRVFPTGPADYTAANPRPPAPEPVGGTVRVAAMNTLNFFVTADFPAGDPLDNKCGPAQTLECRGHDSDQPNEFTRQRDKLVAALAGLNADVIGLNELENTTGVEPLQSIVSELAGYAYINTATIGTDAIKVGLIYKPATVMPVGDFKLLTSAVDPRFLDTKSRPVLAQTFEEIATGARFTVAVNHLKSKGSDCLDVGDPDTGDGQGNCNVTRTRAAQALVDWLATDPTGSGDADFLIIGDLNSYAHEDPIDAVKAGPDDAAGTADDYTNLVAQFIGTFAYSFVFDGMAGYLDHALSSAGLTSQVTGVAEWHINADEPDVLDYDTSFKPPAQDALYEANASRASDHDPILVGLDPATTFADLCRLTRQFVTKPGVADALCEKLATAEAADDAGDTKTKENAINSYINQLEAQTGKSITAERAAQLIGLASEL